MASKISAKDFAARKYDYLVIGGGTAGLVIAARLSEDPNINVGVLEAGGLPPDIPAITVPGRFGEGIGTEIDWQYETTPQPALRDRKLPWPRGKVVGGSSALNFMVWNHPNREDLDAWRDLGNEGWGWDDLSPFYKRATRFEEPAPKNAQQNKLYFEQGALGDHGPISLSYLKELSPSHQYWHSTLGQLEVETNKAHLSGSNVGAWTSVVAVDPKQASRVWSASAYYLPNAERKNLHVLTDATVRHIVIEHEGDALVAKGAYFDHPDGQFVVSATNGVVLSAGSVASPQILELSGIGNPAVLEMAGIEVKVRNDNVGKNLQDHIMTATIYEIDPSIPSPDDLRSDEALAMAADKLYETQRTGPRALLACSLCYVPLNLFCSHDQLTDMAKRLDQSTPARRILAERLTKPRKLGQIEYIFDVGNWSTIFAPEAGKKYGTLLQILQYPFSRGSIHINPESPHGKPVINPQYYEGDHGAVDLEIQQQCARFGQEILNTKPLKDFVLKRAWPPENVAEADWKDWLIDNTITDWHPTGTCAMGGDLGIKGGVVDERLRVYGVRGLRVADASIMPLQISAHLQATVYAIGEKASHMILEDRTQLCG